MKANKEKIMAEANNVLKNLNSAKEAVTLILSGASVNDYGVKVIDEKFNSISEGFNIFMNLVVSELRNAEKVENLL